MKCCFPVLIADTSCRQGKVRTCEKSCSEELLQSTEINPCEDHHFEWLLSDILFTYLIYYKVQEVIVEGVKEKRFCMSLTSSSSFLPSSHKTIRGKCDVIGCLPISLFGKL